MHSPCFSLARLLLPLLVIGLAAGCSKPDLDECRRACWNGNRVMFWAKVDRDAKKMSAEKAAIFRAQREADFQEIAKRDEDQGFMNCVYNCQHNSNDKQIACMKAANTEPEFEVCMK
jgi:hypothetical protein